MTRSPSENNDADSFGVCSFMTISLSVRAAATGFATSEATVLSADVKNGIWNYNATDNAFAQVGAGHDGLREPFVRSPWDARGPQVRLPLKVLLRAWRAIATILIERFV